MRIRVDFYIRLTRKALANKKAEFPGNGTRSIDSIFLLSFFEFFFTFIQNFGIEFRLKIQQKYTIAKANILKSQ